jgi:hypothetical protein
MYRLLVQFYGKNPFGEKLEELGVFETPDEAVEIALSLMDETVEHMLINRGDKWLLNK